MKQARTIPCTTLSRIFVSSLFFASALILAPAALHAQEVIFRYDGQTNREGKSVLNIPVSQGQQLLFRVASLDFQPSLGLSFNGAALKAATPGVVYTERFVRIQKSGTVSVNISATGGVPGTSTSGGSFQFRVIKFRENPPLTHTGVVRGSIAQSDPVDQDGRRIDWYPLSVVKGQKLLIGMASKEADSHLFVEIPDSKVLENAGLLDRSATLNVEVADTATWWVGASILTHNGLPVSSAGMSYSLWVRDMPASPKILTEGSAGLSASLVPVTADLPPLPDEYQFIASRSGIFTFALNPAVGMPSQLRLQSGDDTEIVARPNSKQNGRVEQSLYLRQGQGLNLVVEASASQGRTSYQLSALPTGPAPLLSEAGTSSYDLKPGTISYFTYRGKPGEYVEFVMGSDNFRTRLKVRDEAGQILSWANYFGSDFSYASLGGYYFDQPAELVLEASGFNYDDSGTFSLTLRSSLSSKLDIPQFTNDRSTLADDKPVFARLISRSPVFDGTYGAEYFADLKANELVSVSVKSRDFDTRLVILDADGQALVSNDDFEGSDSLVEYIAPKAGRYRVRVLSPIAEGKPVNVNYSIQLRRSGIATSLNADESGSISDDSPLSDDGRPFAGLTRQYSTGQHIYLVVNSPDFDTRLQLLDSDGVVVDENRGYGQSSASRLDLTLQKTGTYQVRVIARGGANKPTTGSWNLSGWEIH